MPPRHPPCPSIAQHRSRPRANPTDMPGRPLHHPCALPTVDRAPAIKTARPELKFHHSTPPPLPLSLPHHSTLSRAPPGGRNCCRRAAAALQFSAGAEVDIGHESIVPSLPSPSLPSTALPMAAALTCPSPLSVLCPGTSTGARRRPRTAAEEELLAADEPVHPRTRDSAHNLPRASAVDLHRHRRHPSTLGEESVHHRAAGAVAPPILGRRHYFERGPFEPDPTAAYRFG